LTFRVTSILPSSSICAWPSMAESSIATSMTASLAAFQRRVLELELTLGLGLELGIEQCKGLTNTPWSGRTGSMHLRRIVRWRLDADAHASTAGRPLDISWGITLGHVVMRIRRDAV
jgi:hypothetical protein